jgi:hypothetical protein
MTDKLSLLLHVASMDEKDTERRRQRELVRTLVCSAFTGL